MLFLHQEELTLVGLDLQRNTVRAGVTLATASGVLHIGHANKNPSKGIDECLMAAFEDALRQAGRFERWSALSQPK